MAVRTTPPPSSPGDSRCGGSFLTDKLPIPPNGPDKFRHERGQWRARLLGVMSALCIPPDRLHVSCKHQSQSRKSWHRPHLYCINLDIDHRTRSSDVGDVPAVVPKFSPTECEFLAAQFLDDFRGYCRKFVAGEPVTGKRRGRGADCW